MKPNEFKWRVVALTGTAAALRNAHKKEWNTTAARIDAEPGFLAVWVNNAPNSVVAPFVKNPYDAFKPVTRVT